MYYIIASHGEYASACKKSCEMIIGDVPQFKVVTFTAEMTKEAVEDAYRAIIAENKDDTCGAIIVDIFAGTPFNAVAVIRNEHPEIAVVTGLSLAMLISLGSGETLADAVEQAKEAVTAEGIKKEAAPAPAAAPAAPAEAAEDNGIVNFRLDERGIHGQVATFWTRSLGITRIMVVDDALLTDEIGRGALKAAVPAGLKLSILGVDNAAAKLNAGAYAGQRVFLIVRNPATAKRLVELGIKVKEFNVGNMGQKGERKKIKNSIYCTDEEIQTILDIEKAGVAVFAQMVPNDEKKTFASFL